MFYLAPGAAIVKGYIPDAFGDAELRGYILTIFRWDRCRDLFTGIIGHPFAVGCPIVLAVGRLLDADLWSAAVGAVVDCHGAAFDEGDAVAYLHAILNNLDNILDIVIGLQCLQSGLHRHHIAIQLIALGFKFLNAFLMIQKLLPYGGVVETGAGDGQCQCGEEEDIFLHM